MVTHLTLQPIEVLNTTDGTEISDEEAEEAEGVDSDCYTNEDVDTQATNPPDKNTGEDIGTTDTAKLPTGNNGMGNDTAIIGTPTGSDWNVKHPLLTWKIKSKSKQALSVP
jgi:hypothetical protein